MLGQDLSLGKGFRNLSGLFYASFFFSLAANLATTILTVAYVAFGRGSELNPVMSFELKAFGLWVLPFHVIMIFAYYVLFYLTMKNTSMTEKRFKIWCLVLFLIPVLSSFDLAFDLKSVI